MSATNAQMRFKLFRNKDLSLDEKNKILENLTDKELYEVLSNTNGYSEDFLESVMKSKYRDTDIKAIKDALIKVGFFTPTAYILNNNLKEPEEYSEGGTIHIKKKNRGKFTKSANEHGMSVQEYARKVINNPNATTLQKKRAQFAINAKKFKH